MKVVLAVALLLSGLWGMFLLYIGLVFITDLMGVTFTLGYAILLGCVVFMLGALGLYDLLRRHEND